MRLSTHLSDWAWHLSQAARIQRQKWAKAILTMCPSPLSGEAQCVHTRRRVWPRHNLERLPETKTPHGHIVNCLCFEMCPSFSTPVSQWNKEKGPLSLQGRSCRHEYAYLKYMNISQYRCFSCLLLDQNSSETGLS